MQRVCLSMIVKDEAPVIERCLASVRPLLVAWCVVDTGSSDDTPQRVERALAGLPGALHRRPWRNFAANRNEALELARAQLGSDGGWLLLIDADETLELPAGYRLPPLDAAAYEFDTRYGELSYRRVALLDALRAWRYQGVLHEYLECTPPTLPQWLDGPRIRVRPEGARSRNPRKFHDDAALLERALAQEPDNARYWFYLGQSWRDAGEPARALAAYRKRLQLPGWDEESWYAQLQVARLVETLGDQPGAIAGYLDAYARRPTRAEPLVELARLLRARGDWPGALLYARAAAQIPLPADRLFVDTACYQWRALDEWTIAAWWAGCHAEGAQAMTRLLAAPFPESERARIDTNAGYYRERGFLSGA